MWYCFLEGSLLMEIVIKFVPFLSCVDLLKISSVSVRHNRRND